MSGRLFALVNPHDDTEVFAWGVEVTEYDDREAVVIFRDQGSRQLSFGVHASAESALLRWSRFEPMALVWP